jgi:hypothetical protein
VELLNSGTGFGGKTDDISITARHIIFCIFAPLFCRKAGQRFFYRKESEFSLIRLGESGQFANVSTDIGNQARPMSVYCQIQIGGACSSVSY